MSAAARQVDRSHRLLDEALVWDNHGCLPLRPHDESFLPQLRRYRDAQVDVAFINIGFGEQGVEEHVRMLAALRYWLRQRPDEFVLANSVEDIRRAKAEGKLAVGFDIEGMNAIADQPSLVHLYYELGVRWMLIAYNRNNRAGGGCQDEDGGLTEFGRRVIDEMTAAGMVLCCTHTGRRTALEAIDHSPNPVIFSHSNPKALCAHPRNIDDEMMRSCASRGGVIGLSGIGIYLGDNEASAAKLAEHIDYVAQTVGIKHVGLGLDYVFDREELEFYIRSMPDTFPPALYSEGITMVPPEAIPGVVEELLGRGYGDADIGAVLGGNMMRIASEVWR